MLASRSSLLDTASRSSQEYIRPLLTKLSCVYLSWLRPSSYSKAAANEEIFRDRRQWRAGGARGEQSHVADDRQPRAGCCLVPRALVRSRGFGRHFLFRTQLTRTPTTPRRSRALSKAGCLPALMLLYGASVAVRGEGLGAFASSGGPRDALGAGGTGRLTGKVLTA